MRPSPEDVLSMGVWVALACGSALQGQVYWFRDWFCIPFCLEYPLYYLDKVTSDPISIRGVSLGLWFLEDTRFLTSQPPGDGELPSPFPEQMDRVHLVPVHGTAGGQHCPRRACGILPDKTPLRNHSSPYLNCMGLWPILASASIQLPDLYSFFKTLRHFSLSFDYGSKLYLLVIVTFTCLEL